MTDSSNGGRVKAAILAEAVPHIARHAGGTVVVKYGGHAMGDAAASAKFAHDIVFLRQIGMRPIVVHGGGPQIGRMLEQLNIKSDFVDGLRVTDAATVEVVEMVLAGKINKSVVGAIQAAGGQAVGISGKDGDTMRVRHLERRTRDPDSNIERILDLGFVGEPNAVDTRLIDSLADAGFVPVVAPIGVGPGGETYNVNADTAAGAIAAACKAKRFLLLTDVTGVLDRDGQLIAEMSGREAEALVDAGVITGGMIPKVETCLEAVRDGVEAAVIMDGRVDHAVLLELLTESGVGTMIRHD